MTSCRVRCLTAAFTVGAALVAAPASYAEDYLLQIGASPASPYLTGNTAVQVSAPSGPPGEGDYTLHAPARMRISRGGTVLDDRTGEVQGGWLVVINSDVVLAPGDRVEIFYPASAAEPSRDLVWDGRPTLDSCAVGATTVGGTQDVGPFTVNGADHPGTFIQSVLAERPAPSGAYNAAAATVTQAGEAWTGMFGGPLLAGDVVVFAAHYRVDPAFTITRHVRAAAGTCATDPAAPAPVSAEPAVPSLDGALRRLRKRDVVQRKSTVRVRVGCRAASRIACRGRAVLARAGKTVRSRRLSLRPGRSTLIELQLTRRVVRQLAHKSALRARVVASSSDPAGKRLATSRALLLRR